MNVSARASGVLGAAGVGRKGESQGLSVKVTGKGEKYEGGVRGVCV